MGEIATVMFGFNDGFSITRGKPLKAAGPARPVAMLWKNEGMSGGKQSSFFSCTSFKRENLRYSHCEGFIWEG